jgi:hypothetical protein
MTDVEPREHPGRLFVGLAVATLVGVPIVAVLWGSLNALIDGELRAWILAVPSLVAVVVFLVVFGRWVRGLERTR